MTLPDPIQDRRKGERRDSEHVMLLRFRAALVKIAAYDDVGGNVWLRKYGNYSRFDEPSSVKIARDALDAEPRNPSGDGDEG